MDRGCESASRAGSPLPVEMIRNQGGMSAARGVKPTDLAYWLAFRLNKTRFILV